MTGAELRRLRKSIDWTKTRMAEELDVNPITVRRWESSRKIPRITEYAIRFLTQSRRRR